jgi:uncharacterized protein (TIGR02271 family)
VVDRAVCDSEGNKIGNAKHVFLDDVTGVPEWVSVKTGLFGSSESFVPIREATMADEHLEVPYAKETVKKARHVDVDAGGHLSVDEEHRLYDYYGIAWDAAWQQANQPGEKGWATDGTAAGTATGTAAGTAAGAATRAAAGTAAGVAAAGNHGPAGGEATMIRSEERMHVGTERREAGRARVRKYVVIEEHEQTVPLRHEEVRLEREPITEADRDAAASAAITEEEREITLHEERPVTEIETVPVERVRLTTEEVTEAKTVRGEVRKEKIEAEAETDTESDRR